jgi:alanyl-tRNA synthetase
MAMELLLDEYKLDKDRLYATYFEGNPNCNLEPDLEAKEFWKLYLAEDHILPGNMKDNFWEMGETGPCGPCSELHFDRIGGGRNAAHLVNKDDPDVLEIWNLVFIQFNRENDGSLKPLPGKHVDTGMGFERITSVIQDKRSNYDTDLFMPIFTAIEKGTGTRPYTGLVGDADTDKTDMAYRVVADHIRTLSISISDGGRPDNVGRGYVLRRILRRGIRFAIKKLNAKPGFFASLVDTVVEILGDAFPELKRDPQYVKDVINEEEEQFLKTLTRGQRLLEKTISKLETNKKQFPGDIAWRLYDTYGFPIDLTQLICEENGLFIDMNQYNESKQQSQLQSQQVTAESDDTILLDVHSIDELKSKFFLFSNDAPKYNYQFDTQGNYDLKSCQAKIKAIRYNKQFVNEVKAGQTCGLLLDQTSFYAEQGGQTFDEGYITLTSENAEENDEQSEFIVKTVQVRGGFILHVGVLTSSNLDSTFKVGDSVSLHVDMVRRRQIMNNHTGTHVLNYALRKVLNEADQRGSLVAPDRLRFDFTAKKAMTVAEVGQVEQICNEIVDKKLDVFAKETPLSIAKAIQGLRAVFDETYPDPVRVVSVGKQIEDLIADPNGPAAFEYSVEFCGGTHLLNSEHIERVVVVSEEAIAKGVRRIIAVTGSEALKAVKKAEQLEKEISLLGEDFKEALLDSKENLLMAQKNLNKRLSQLGDDISASAISHVKRDAFRNRLQGLKKQLDDIDKANKLTLLNEALEESKKLIEDVKNSGNGAHIVREFKVNGDAKSLNSILTSFKQQLPNTCCMFFSIDYINNKIVCLSSVPDVSIVLSIKLIVIWD